MEHPSCQHIEQYLQPGKHCHLVGIGGVSMRPLGLVLRRMGMEISGSDMNASVSTDELIAKGIQVSIGHRAENIQGADCIIRTAAAHNDNPEVAAARAQGIIIYCIGLVGSDGVDVEVLNDWATDPAATHVAVTPDTADLEKLFAELAANISKTGATNIVINEKVTDDFIITSVLNPTVGSATMLNSTSLRWTIPALGVSAPESATLEFYVRHVGQNPGTKLVNESITYSDTEGNVVDFPEPTVSVECDVVVNPEECPVPADLTIEGCSDSVVVDMGNVYLESLGRIIQMDVTIKNVCPGKRVALAAILTEVDENGMEYQRGSKAMTIPAHNFPTCRDVLVKCIKFVLPEDLDISGGSTQVMCNPRSFKARFIAHNIDSDFRCCESVLTL